MKQKLLTSSHSFSEPEKASLLLHEERKFLPGLHGLRCFAALAVVIFHLKGIALVPPPAALLSVTDTFGSSVRLFFILSAFSLMYSTSVSLDTPFWIEKYAIRRFFRIAPVFYLMIVLTLLWNYYLRGTHTELGELILNLTFLFGLVSDRQTSVVLGGWTIGAEVIFYASFPLILGTIRGLRSAVVFLGIAIFVGWATASLAVSDGQPWWIYAMSFPMQLEYFCAGLVFYFVSTRLDKKFFEKKHWLVFGICIGLYALVILWDGFADRVTQMALFGLLCIWQALCPSKIMSSRFAVFVGERSYGIYLIHSPLQVILRPQFVAINHTFGPTFGYFINMLFVLSVTLFLAHLIYVLVERPGIRIGRYFLRRLSPKIQSS